MKKRSMQLIAVFTLAWLLSGFACTNGTQRLATASDAIAHALANAQVAAQQAVQAGVMSQSDYTAFNQYLGGAATTGLQLDAAIRANESASDVSQKVTNFMNAFNALQKTGVIGIKDPKTQLAISTIIAGAETSLAVIEASLGGK